MANPPSITDWLTAIGTVGAVTVALFKDEILRRFRRPKLSVRITPEAPDCLLSPSTVGREGRVLWSGNIYWLRLWIENVGTVRAEQVQVFASKLFKRNANREFTPVSEFTPMNLRWANARDWKNPEIFAPGISHKNGQTL